MNSEASAERVVIDASALVDLLVGSPLAGEIRHRLGRTELHGPAHLDAEVLSALGRLHRAGHLSARQAAIRIDRLATAPIERHPLPPLLPGAWRLRGSLRLVDALYAALANELGAPIVTSDGGMAAAVPGAELISGP